jgi:hypothetical protein
MHSTETQASDDRRSNSRESVRIRVDTYVDGRRRPGMLLDYSSTGGHCRCDHEAQPGDRIAVGFRHPSPEDSRIYFLLGRVIWRNDGAFGLHWLKALAHTSAEELRVFLLRVLGHSARRVEEVAYDGTGGRRSLYTFPDERSPSAVNRELLSHRQERASMPIEEPTVATASGPLTTLVSRSGLRAPCNIGAWIRVREEELKGTIRYLGATGLFVEIPLSPRPQEQLPEGKILVRFILPGVDGQSPVHVRALCTCIGTDDGSTTGTEGLDLSILQLDDSDGGRMLTQAIRQLHLEALSGS